MNTRRDDIRRYHYLKHNSRSAAPSNLLFFDTETMPSPVPGKPNRQLHTLRLWSAIACRLDKGKVTRRHDYLGTTASEFWSMLHGRLDERRPLWVFAHNIGFDLTTVQFWRLLEDGIFVLEKRSLLPGSNGGKDSVRKWKGLAVISDPPVIISVQDALSKASIIFVDTLNYFRCPLSTLGEHCGLPKVDMPPLDANDVEWQWYCHRDADIVHQTVIGLIEFCRTHDLGNFRYTAPAQAMSAYRHRFMKTKLLVHGHAASIKLERESYYGGRCQALFIGRITDDCEHSQQFFGISKDTCTPWRRGPVYVLDYKSFYPSVMKGNKYPVRLEGYCVSPTLTHVAKLLENYHCIARVMLKSHGHGYPCRINGLAAMAQGTFVTTLADPELRLAILSHDVEAIGAVSWYQAESIFDDYVDYFWALRKIYTTSGNVMYAELCKLLSNSLFGKFGQKGRAWVNEDDKQAPFPWGNWSEVSINGKSPKSFRSLAWQVQSKAAVSEHYDSMPAIAATVTAYGRVKIEGAIAIADRSNVYYVDTDSLHVNEIGLRHLQESGIVKDNELGMLRLIGTYGNAEYRGLKNYTIGDTHVIAGIKRNAIQDSRGRFRQLSFQGLRSILAGPIPDGVMVEEVIVDHSGYLATGKLDPSGHVADVVLDNHVVDGFTPGTE